MIDHNFPAAVLGKLINQRCSDSHVKHQNIVPVNSGQKMIFFGPSRRDITMDIDSVDCGFYPHPAQRLIGYQDMVPHSIAICQGLCKLYNFHDLPPACSLCNRSSTSCSSFFTRSFKDSFSLM